MEITEIILKKITPKEGYLLTDGETITDVLFMRNIPAADIWWEIPDPNYMPQYDGTDFLRPITYMEGMAVTAKLWYTDGEDIWEAIKDGIPAGFDDTSFFDIIV